MAAAGLRGPSVDARAALQERLADATGSGGADAAGVGEDLFGVAALLRSEPGLRRVATDVSTESEAKQRLARQILEGKVAATSLELVADAFGRRWTMGRDLPDAMEHLGVVAVVRSAEDSERLADELFELGQLITAHPDLRSALSDPARSTADKQALLSGLLEGKVSAATVRLASQALAGSHRTVSLAIEDYQRTAASVHGERVARVRVAKALTDGERQRLEDALRRQYDRPVHLNVIVEPALMGGMRVEIGDDVIDGTVSTRLDEARRQLVR